MAQDINVGGRLARTQYQYTLLDANLDELDTWAPKILAKMKTLPELRDVASDQQTGGATLTLTIDRDQAARFGIQPALIDNTLYDAYGQRRSHAVFHPAQQLSRRHGGPARAAGPAEHAQQLYVNSPITGQQVPLSTLVKWTTRPTTFLSINHQDQFPAVHPVLQSGAGRGAGPGRGGGQCCRGRDGHAGTR